MMEFFDLNASIPAYNSAHVQTLVAVLAAREKVANSSSLEQLTMYTSDQAHSSVIKAGMIAGIPRDNIRALPTSPDSK